MRHLAAASVARPAPGGPDAAMCRDLTQLGLQIPPPVSRWQIRSS